MSQSFQKIGDIDATEDEANQLADDVLRWLVAEHIIAAEPVSDAFTDGGHPPGSRSGQALHDPALDDLLHNTLANARLSVDVGRQVYFGGQTRPTDPACPHCGAHLDGIDHGNALGNWMRHGKTHRLCPHCNQASHINTWTMQPQWGIGHLQLCFWNWPQLHTDFLAQIAERLGGHTLIYLYDKA